MSSFNSSLYFLFVIRLCQNIIFRYYSRNSTVGIILSSLIQHSSYLNETYLAPNIGGADSFFTNIN